MKWKCFWLSLNVFLVLLSLAAPAVADTISMSSSGDIAAVGDAVTIHFQIIGLTSGIFSSLSAFDINVLYDPKVLALTSFSFIDPASGLNQLDLAEPGAFPFLGAVDDPLTGVIDSFGVSGNTAGFLD